MSRAGGALLLRSGFANCWPRHHAHRQSSAFLPSPNQSSQAPVICTYPTPLEFYGLFGYHGSGVIAVVVYGLYGSSSFLFGARRMLTALAAPHVTHVAAAAAASARAGHHPASQAPPRSRPQLPPAAPVTGNI